MSHGDYVFTLGNGERTYKGSRLRILEGFEFFGEVSVMVSKLLASPASEIDLTEILKGDEAAAIAFGLKCISQLDNKAYMSYFKMLLTKTQITARAGTEHEKYLTTEKEVNDWFSKYPSDMLQFSFKIIWENVTPFLPSKGVDMVADILSMVKTPYASS